MNENQRGVAALLKSAVTGESADLPAGFDLESVYPALKPHHMAALLYEGAARCGISRKAPIMQQLFQEYYRALLKSEGQLRELERIFTAFAENGIDHLPLKGCKMKALYPKPELRTMGDADILIRTGQSKQIRQTMQQLGYYEKGESDHEWVWTVPALHLELHKHLIPSYTKDLYAYFGNGWQLAVKGAGSRYSMRPEDEFLFMFIHFTKHYRDGGIGCRYVVDLWVYCRANPQLDEAYIRAELEKLQLLRFYENIRRLMQAWFEDGQTDEVTDFITDFIFDSGSWGKMEDKVISVGVRNSKEPEHAAKGKRRYVSELMFPTVGVLRDKYPVLQKAPWMLPAVWLYRPFYKVLRERDSLKRHKQRIGLLTQENLTARQQALRYVGLDYNF